MSHRYGFSPLCVLLWRSMWYFWINRMLHWSQLKGFSPVESRTNIGWFVNTSMFVMFLEKEGITNGRNLPLWIFSCRWRRYFWMKLMLHWLQRKGLSPVWQRTQRDTRNIFIYPENVPELLWLLGLFFLRKKWHQTWLYSQNRPKARPLKKSYMFYFYCKNTAHNCEGGKNQDN